MKRSAILLSSILAAIMSLPASADAGIFNNQAFKMKITFSGYNRPETLTNFPVLIALDTHLPGFRYNLFADPATGGDLRFADSNSTTSLNYEIDRWNSNGTTYIWVQAPAISSTNDFIWAFWGGGAYTNPPACTTNGSTWSNGYAGVWHMNSTNDSTANHNDATLTGTPANVSSSSIAGGYDFTGSNYLSCASAASLNITGSVTISSWVYWRSGRGFISKEYQSNGGYASEIDDGAGNIRWYTWGLSTNSDMRSSSPFPKNGWHHLALVYDNINGRKNIYFDGTLDSTTNAASSITVNSDAFYMGFSRLTGDAPYYFNGMLDEMRLSNVARSTNWLWASCENQKSSSEFISYDKTTVVTDGTVIIIR